MSLHDAIRDLVNSAPLREVHKLDYELSKPADMDVYREIGLHLCSMVANRMGCANYADAETEFYNKKGTS